MTNLSISDWNKLCTILNGYIDSIAIATACEMNLFDWLSHHPGTSREEIADGLSLSLHPTRILLLACCNAGLVERDPNNLVYFNSHLAEQVLISDSPLSIVSYVKFNRYVQLQGCLHFSTALRENRNAGLDEFPGKGETLYERLKTHPDLELLFQEGMSNYTRLSPKMVDISEFARVNHLLDVGGGDGTNAIRLCQKYPLLKVSILELPSVCKIGQSHVDNAGLTDRIKFIQADMYEDPWPINCDGILMSHLVEILSLDKILFLYKKAYKTLLEGGHIFIWTLMSDSLEKGGLQAAKAAIYLFTVASGEGMPWPAKEHIDLLKKAGFKLPIHFSASEIDHGVLIAEK